MRTNQEVKTIKRDGKIIYTSEYGTLDWIDTWDKVFNNSTFSFSGKDYEPCYRQLITNTTDINTELYMLSDDTTHFTVPVPSVPQTVSILAGYDLRNISKHDVASALLSYQLLDTTVYLTSAMFLLIFLLMVIAVSLLQHYRELYTVESNGMEDATICSKKTRITRRGHKVILIKQQLTSLVRGSYSDCKSISFLFSVLTFYLIIYFSSVYSTSNIVLNKPDLCDSYQKLVEHPKATAFINDFMMKISPSFEFASATSLKGKIWSKRMPPNRARSLESVVKQFQEIYRLMRDYNSVVIVSSTFNHLTRSLMCSMSREEKSSPLESLRYITRFVDPSEPEQLYGFPLSIYFKNIKLVTSRLRLMEQSALFTVTVTRLSQQFYQSIQPIMKQSDGYIMKQKLACDGQLTVHVDPPQPVEVKFFSSLIYSLLTIQLLTLFVLLVEHNLKIITQKV